MGYYIDLQKSKFNIKAANVSAVLAAMKKLGSGADDDRAGGGGSYQDGTTKSWFRWMNDVDFEDVDCIEEAFEVWWFPIERNDQGDVVAIEFSGEKSGDEKIMFDQIATLVELGSFIEMRGEDGARWRWEFDGTICTRNGLKSEKTESERSWG